MPDLISQNFLKKNKKLVTFITAGDPDFDTCNKIIENIIKNKVDILEIGMPFSDPMADGPTIQLSSTRALKNETTLEEVFKLSNNAKKFNKELPVILMGYYNVIFHYGIENFVEKCLLSGVDGLIIVDLQPEEDEDLIKLLNKNNIKLIRLITPTTDEKRLQLILKNASGFLYYVSVMGVTGQKSANINELERSIKFVRRHTDLPIIPGFGINNSEDVKRICKISDGAVVGSSIIKIIERNLDNKKQMLEQIDTFIKELKLGTNI